VWPFQLSRVLTDTDEVLIVQMPIPDLPLDAFYVIGCHLAGTYAFGTLANLHIASHDVADIVLPVLYETVLADNKLPVLGAGQLGSPDRFRYTK
jgi:hypothetical protein